MTGFALVMAGAAIAALLLMLLMKKKTGIKTQSAFIFGALAVPLCVLIGRAGFWICNIEWQKKIGASFLDFLGSGYSYMLYGAVIGGFIAAFLTVKISGDSFGKIIDAAAAPAALLIAAGRFAEYLVEKGAGFGVGVVDWFDPYEEWSMIAWEEPDAICRFPFAVQNYYGTWKFAINLWEGLAAIIFLIVLLRMRKRKSGGAASLHQLISALLVLGLLIFFWLKQPRTERKVPELCIRTALLLVFAGIIMLMEFALDQKINFLLWMRVDLNYLVMAACCVGMLLTVLPQWRKAFPKEA